MFPRNFYDRTFAWESAYDLRIQNSKQNGYFNPKILFDFGFGRKMFPIEKYITLGRMGDVLELFYDSNEFHLPSIKSAH